MKSLMNICRSLFLLCLAATAIVQLAAQKASISKPVIDKIDPPGWWTELPDPMLLVHGEGLDNARFTVAGKGVSLIKTQPAANGHWSFLWIKTRSAAAQTLQITATNDKGQAKQAFQLAKRSSDAGAHSGFSSADVMYLIMTDRFADGETANDPAASQRSVARGWHGGDFAGIEQHLDYLKALGVTAVWTTPVASNAGMTDSYHGYAATDLYNTDAHFGTLQQYRQLSDALHAKGMKLVIDLVPNHLGVQHPWVLDPPAPEWFHGTLQDHHRAQYNFYNLVDPHAPREAWRDITNGWFTDQMPDLNQENPLVSRYLIQNALWWVETANLDGIRLDTFPYVGRAFWHDFHAALHEAYPHLTTVGEVYHRDPEVTSFFAGGAQHRGIDTGLDTPFDFPVYFTIRDVLTHSKPMTELRDVLRQDALYPHPERLVTFIGNHDTKRFLTDADGSVPRLKLALGLMTTLRGMPQIYSGDEIGMSGGEDPDNRHDFPGGFAGDSHSAFNRAGRTTTEQDVFAWTSGLIALRSAHPALKTGMEQDLFADEDSFAFVRATTDAGCSANSSENRVEDRVLIVINKADQAKSIDLPMQETALAGCTVFQGQPPAAGSTPVIDAARLHIQEPPQSMSLYIVR